VEIAPGVDDRRNRRSSTHPNGERRSSCVRAILGARMTPSEATTTGPVTVTFIRHVKPGRERDYEQALAKLHERVHGMPGYLGTNVVHEPGTHDYASIVRFDSLANLHRFEQTRLRETWENEMLQGVVVGPAEEHRAEGVEFWFEAPKHPARVPSQHKMAGVLVVVVWCVATPFSLYITPQLSGIPAPLRVLVAAAFQVSLMTYVIMPRVTRLLAGWLFPP
jgi:antibiotic biosynthesis monooxygenase (ABM) superfamily enzyme